jgi:ribonuclease HII
MTDNSTPTRKPRTPRPPLPSHLYEDLDLYEIGVDEVGRGPLFGRVYVAATVLPRNDPEFKYDLLKDSKRFTSEKKIQEVAQHIRDRAQYHTVEWADEKEIDRLNIRNATLQCMARAVKTIHAKLIDQGVPPQKIVALVDGDAFRPITYVCPITNTLQEIRHECHVGGDDRVGSIAAASIIAKVARDQYVKELCATHPTLDTWYGLSRNKGYGTKQHRDGIAQHGITQWHRRSYGAVGSAPEVAVSVAAAAPPPTA